MSNPGLSTQRVLAVALSTLLVCSEATAQPTVAPPALTAAFLYNFAQFAEWPAHAEQTGPLTICVLGATDVADALDGTVKRRTVKDRPIAVSRVQADGLRACHVLYFTDLDPKRTQQIIDELKNSPVLTVSDLDRFAQSGGIIGLFVESGKMRFAINVDAAARARLHISSRLLSLAMLVKDGPVRP